MRRVTRNGVIAVAAASGAMALTAPAHAGSWADGATAGSPGLISGNTVQLPVAVPVEVCGNTVNVAGLLNPAAGNGCATGGEDRAPDAPASEGSHAHARGKDSSGLLSGNGVQLPVHLPVNISGNTATVIGAGNTAVGNTSGALTPRPSTPPRGPSASPRTHPHPATEHAGAALAHTGTDAPLFAAATSAALLLAGTAVYRRSRPRAGR